MNLLTASITLVATLLLCTLPRRYAVIPLLVGASYVTRDAGLEIGTAHFTVLHIMVLFGLLRVVLRREGFANGSNAVDWIMISWAAVFVGSTFFHTADEWLLRIGIAMRHLGAYFLLRIFIQDYEDIRRVFKVLCLILVPIAILMLRERAMGQNLFEALGGYGEVAVRNGQFRARGPFAHPILAGTIGALCFPIALHMWRTHRLYALLGLFAGSAIIYAVASSGPVIMVAFTLFAVILWNARSLMRTIRWLAILAILALNAVMQAPVYYLMARIDVAGGSSGWYRARLIQSSIEHFNEWWLVGTDYTRHWMATGIWANQNHADIVNHYLWMGVKGGLILMSLTILAIVASFKMVGRTVRDDAVPADQRFLAWTLGAMLFGYVMVFFTSALFDQSVLFYYAVLAGIGALQVAKSRDIGAARARPPSAAKATRTGRSTPKRRLRAA